MPRSPTNGDDGAFVREHPHAHADYLAAFRSAELTLVECLEPRLTADQVTAKRRAFRHIPDATMQAYAGLPAVLVWDLAKRDGRARSR